MKNPWKDALAKRRMDGLDLTITIAPSKKEDDEESELAPDVEHESNPADIEEDMAEGEAPHMLEDPRIKMSALKKRAMGK
jgi:hypothetical protein